MIAIRPQSDVYLVLNIPFTKNTPQSNFQTFFQRSRIILNPALRPPINNDVIDVPPSTLNGLYLCKEWLHRCVIGHEQCHSTMSNRRSPTRLIFIRGLSLRVCETAGNIGSIKYATLSHCWGGKDFLKLVRANLASFQVKIPYEDLSNTFQDAIFIARYLGFEHLWIDSLCIIQDDEDDWATESTLMTDVYGGSHLNIAAVSAENGDAGCFFKRNRN
ncbi:heterokaryon incompatibility protein-domain-containing protein [Cadophora sp. MPI-SDFR-AT-0126]|nr:heterokaryon incompatibility protein-domain-containing protein [Leotiomycetes sp. MPI-SDFR-AT-0126]